MLSGFGGVLSQIVNLFQWWIIIAPWEQAIRVRRGNKSSVLGPGVHFRIPGFDRFFVQSTRKRYMNTPTQTVTTRDRQAVTVSGGTAYSIISLVQLYTTLSDPEDVIQIETMGLVARYVSAHDLADLQIDEIEDYVDKELDLRRYGLFNHGFRITDFVSVRTYRIINSSPKDWTNASLNTQAERTIGTRTPS